MYTIQHYIWLLICLTFIVGWFYLIKKYNLTQKQVFSIACIICVLSESIKVFTAVKMVPIINGVGYFPYLEMRHMPFHLCSLQIIFIFFQRYAPADSKIRKPLYTFMFPTCILGALAALAIPTVFTENVAVEEAFSHPIAYQYFLYHAMLIALGIYIMRSDEIKIKSKDYLTTMLIMIVAGFITIYFNSIFSIPRYENGDVVAVEAVTNYFVTAFAPIAIPLIEKWHWYLYLVVIFILASLSAALLYLPIFIRDYKQSKLMS